jgi:hypothetical protein
MLWPLGAYQEPLYKTQMKKEGTVNAGTRTTKAEYLRHHTETVAIINEKGEYEIKPTSRCKKGDVVWVLESDNTFTETKIC